MHPATRSPVLAGSTSTVSGLASEGSMGSVSVTGAVLAACSASLLMIVGRSILCLCAADVGSPVVSGSVSGVAIHSSPSRLIEPVLRLLAVRLFELASSVDVCIPDVLIL